MVFISTYSQNGGGEAIYRIILQGKDPKIKISKNEEFEKKMQRVDNEASNLRPKLKFNNNYAVFYIDSEMELEAQLASSIYCGCDIKKYTDLKVSKTFQYSQGGLLGEDGEFLIEEKIHLNWKIEKEKKNIDSYECIKATQLVVDEENRQKLVTAWFCSELPFPYGPKGYGGLPGLIIELQIDKVVFGLEKITLSQNDLEIKMPVKGKKISFEDYNELSKKRFEEFKKEN